MNIFNDLFENNPTHPKPRTYTLLGGPLDGSHVTIPTGQKVYQAAAYLEETSLETGSVKKHHVIRSYRYLLREVKLKNIKPNMYLVWEHSNI